MSRRIALAATIALMGLPGILPGAAAAQPPTRNFVFKAQRNDYAPPPGGQNYSACWSYIHSDGREYAVIGVNGLTATTGGSAIYNVTDPAAPYLVGFISGPQSVWREFKSYRDWIYIVTEGGGTGFGLQIVRMTNPEAPVLAATYTTNFRSSHTVAVDTTRGILVCNGTRNASGLATGVRILALNNPGIGATPETPVEIAWWPGGAIPVSTTYYVHDSVPIGDRLYASSIYPGVQRVLNFTNPAAPSEIAAWNYPGGFTHNAWPDATGDWLYVTDETKGEPLKVFDISNLASPLLVNGITSNPQSIVHNAHVLGDVLHLASYTEGIRALDLSDPAHPAEFAWADSYAGPSGGFSGVWEVCPYFPSGTVIASDRNSGLYVYRLEHDYGILRAKVVDGLGVPFPGVATYLTTLGDSLTTPADGIVQFAPGPGSHTVLARKFGYYDASATRTVSVGSRDTVALELLPRPTALFTGVVRDQSNGNPLAESEVSLAYTGLHQHTGAGGLYSMSVPDDIYRLQVRRGGYVPLVFERRIGPGFPGEDYALAAAPFWDPLEVAGSWTVGATGDDATAGIWTRVVPIGSGPRPPSQGPNVASAAGHTLGATDHGTDASGRLAGAGARSLAGRLARVNPQMRELLAGITFAETDGSVESDRGARPASHDEEPALSHPNMAPYFDHTPGTGTMCFVTGNSTDSTNVDAADVDGGRTSLTTPVLNLSGMAEPTIGFWRWFASYHAIGTSSGHNGPDPNDYLAVLISNDNGATWTAVDTTRGLENHWAERTIRVADHVTPTALVRLRFVAADTGPATTCEAAIDDLVAYDAATVPVTAPPTAPGGRLAFRAPWPNPATGTVRLVLDLPRPGEVVAEVLDLSGRRVRTLHRGAAAAGPLALAWDGRDAAGHELPAGLYFARAEVRHGPGAGPASGLALARLVRIR